MITCSGLNYALKILEKRAKSVGELKAKLIQKKFPKEEIESTIKKLLDNKFLDDEQYAKNFIKEKIEFKHEGKRRIAFELKRKLVSDDIIKKELSSVVEEVATAEEAAKKWLKIRAKSEKVKEKLFRHLVSKGFDYETIKQIIDKVKQ